MDAKRWIRERSSAARGARQGWKLREWQIWALPNWLAGFIVVVVLADVAFFAVQASRITFTPYDLELFGAALISICATVELTRRAGENAGFVKDVFAVWELPVAFLLPLAYAPLAPVIRFALTQWRTRRVPLHKRVFSAAVIGLSYVAAAVVFHALLHMVQGSSVRPTGHALAWMAIAVVGAGVQWVVNQALILTAIKGSNPSVSLREQQFAREPMYNDISELCVAVLVAFGVASSIFTLVIAFPFVTLLQRSLRHTRLLEDARADSKTGLLNAATWERDSTAELARAVRTKSALAVALLDIDKFKRINDTYGHMVGDLVIKEIARTLTSELRDYDLAGRFGGEEFSLLLPQTRAVDALRIAERVRATIAGLSIIAPGASGGERVHVTVSIGVAALDSGSQREFGDLMAAADAALYRAKASGRDQVQMISTTRGLSAVSSIPRPVNGAGGPAPDTFSVFRPLANRAVNS